MVKVAILKLNDPKNWNLRWIIGQPDDVPKTSPFYSEQIQIKYHNKQSESEKDIHLKKERENYHSHYPLTEELLFVLNGCLEVKVDNEIIKINSMEILTIPPNSCHKIVDYSLPIQFLTIRAPISKDKQKCKE